MQTITTAQIISATTDTDGEKVININGNGLTLSGTVKPYIKQNNTVIPAAVFGYIWGETIKYSLRLAAGNTAVFTPEDPGDSFVPGPLGTIVVAIPAGDGYKSAEVTLTITE